MAYNPTVWEENDLLSADRMNKIENGIAEASETPDGLLPAGGTAGQMLTKASDNDFDTEWAYVPESVTINDVNALIDSKLPKGSDNFFEIYGLDTSKDSITIRFDLGGAYSTTSVKNSDSAEYVANKLDGRFSPYGYEVYYDPVSNKILANDDEGNALDLQVTVDGTEVTPQTVQPTFVTKFNGRYGKVVPQSGDYTAEMVGAIANTNISGITVLTEAEYDAMTAKDATTLYLVKEEA